MTSFLKTMTEKLEKLKNDPEERKWEGDFTFVQGADCQFGLIDRYIFKKEIPNWDKEIKLSEAAIEQINGLVPKPKFFVICGDMLDAFPYAGLYFLDPLSCCSCWKSFKYFCVYNVGKERELRNEQLADFHKVYSKVDPEIPLICVCGNHDVGDIPTKENVQIYREQFGEDFFIFWKAGVRFVVLNSQYYMNSDDVEEELAKQNALVNSLKNESGAVHTGNTYPDLFENSHRSLIIW